MMQGEQRYLFGLFIAMLMLVLFTSSIASCTKKDVAIASPPYIPVDTTPLLAKRSYLALGDSYTIGQSVAVEQRFPHQTMAILNTRGYRVDTPQYIAQTGWTTGALLQAISAQNPMQTFDVVSLLIGVNNQYQRRDTFEYRQQFTQCLKEAIRLAGNKLNRVFVLSIPDYSVTPYGRSADPARISKEIDGFNAINKSVTDSAGIVWIEITTGSREAIADPALIAIDGLHPSGKEYTKWAAKLAEEMAKVLR
jgi:lysophospholipase L1-like esterase